MRLCAAARLLAVISIALMVGSAYEVGVRGPYWPAWLIATVCPSAGPGLPAFCKGNDRFQSDDCLRMPDR